jgi:NADP-dependent aldehyde dehydrogenase
MTLHPVLIAGRWRPADSSGAFSAHDPALGEELAGEYPISRWADCDTALDAATEAAARLRTSPPERIAAFLGAYARRIEARKAELVDMAHAETGLARAPRLADIELPRTTGQLRQGAAAALEGSWALPTIDTKLNIRSVLAPIGPVWVFAEQLPVRLQQRGGGDFVRRWPRATP